MLFVSHDGTDDTMCGKTEDKPCQSLSYAVQKASNGATVFLKGGGSAYVHEQDNPILVDKSLTIASLKDTRALLSCRSTLFRVGADNQKVTLNIKEMTITGCPSQTGAIVIHNGRVSVSDTKMTNNGLLFTHAGRMRDCKRVDLSLHNTEMTTNQAGIRLIGCDSMKVDIKGSSFQSSPILLQALKQLDVTITDTTFDGSSSRQPSFDCVLGKDKNVISFSRVDASKHTNTEASPIRIKITDNTSEKPHINIKESTFHLNQMTRSNGGVLSILADPKVSNPLLINTVISKCTFTDNSAQGNGGAISMANIRGVSITQCTFTNNRARNGAAIFTENASEVTIHSSQFETNVAKGKDANAMATGGAVHSNFSAITVTKSTFTTNEATTHGSAISMEDPKSLEVISCTFVHKNPKVNLINAQDLMTPANQVEARISIVGSTFDIPHGSTSSDIISGTGPINMKKNSFRNRNEL